MSNHLVGAAEVAEMLHVSRQRVAQLAASFPGFPQPEVEIAAGRIWKREDIEEWIQKNPQRLAIAQRAMKCSFCGRGQDEVRKLVSAPNANICESCADAALAVILEDEGADVAPRVASRFAELGQVQR